MEGERGSPIAFPVPAFPPPHVTSFPVPDPASDPVPPSAPVAPVPPVAPVRVGRRHERRLLAAFEAVDLFPCLQGSRDHVVAGLADERGRDDIVAAIEADLGLAMRVLREAQRVSGAAASLDGTVPEAVERLGRERLRAVVERAPAIDVFATSGSWGDEPFRYRRHVIGVQSAVQRIVRRTGTDGGDLDRLLAAAVLHDVGKLVLLHANGGDRPSAGEGSPEQRLAGERHATGIDHALVGGVLVRRWGLAGSLARLVECHHADAPRDEAHAVGVLRLADMLAHYGRGGQVDPVTLTEVARRIGIDRGALRELLHEQDGSLAPARRRASPSPLSPRETEVLRLLAEGLVYKQIAGRLDLATSTVRTHLHNIYFKLDAVDRAQAVLTAVRNEWI